MLHSFPLTKPLYSGGLIKSRISTNYYHKKSIKMEINASSSSSSSRRGALIVVEGLDRSGKTLQSTKLVSYLEGVGYPAEFLGFPDRNTCIGQIISSYLSKQLHLDHPTAHLLFSANRWEKRSMMEDKLKSGTTLVVDRYSYSGVAFSSAKGLDVDWCKAPEVGFLAPDTVLYLEIPPEKAAKREGFGEEKYEHVDFQKKVGEKYQALRDASWKTVDACLPMEEVHKQMKGACDGMCEDL